jgi:LPXTG-motif cell wall-anchored protein
VELDLPMVHTVPVIRRAHCRAGTFLVGMQGGEVIRRLAVVLGALAGLLLATAAPASAQYNPSGGFIIEPSTIPDTGAEVFIEGIGCPAASTANISILVDGQEIFLGSTPVDNDVDGGFRTFVNVPPIPAGEYTVFVRCGNVVFSNVLTVVATTQPTSAPLPRTGTDPTNFIRIAFALIAAGGLLVLAARRRRHAYS